MQEQVIRVIRPNSFYKYAVKPIHRLRGWDAALCLLIIKNKDWQYSTTFGLRNQPSTGNASRGAVRMGCKAHLALCVSG
jgi:hypothetical protein